jgi:hypothetical protein
VNRSNNLPAFILVLFFALLLLLTGSSVLSWAPEPTSESREATRQADAKVLADEAVDVTKEVPVDSQVIDLSQDPRAVQLSENDQQEASPVDATLNKIPHNIRGVQTHLKHHVHQAFDGRTFSRHRPTANLVTRIHSWLVGELGLARTTSRRPWKDSYKWTKHQKAVPRKFALR